jgi:PAS domain S-box-containing protein
MPELNKLLTAQMKKHLGELDKLPESVSNLLSEISESYCSFESDQSRKEDQIKGLTDDLSNTQTELNRIFNIVSEGFYSKDLIKNQYNYLSAGCQKIYGYSIEDFKNNVELWYEVIHPEDRKIIEGDYERLSNGESITSEYRIMLKDGSIRWIEITVVPVFSDSKLTQVDGIIKNITERKLAEQKLEEQNKELIKTNSELDRFVYSASHELRSPLTSILGLVALTKLQTTDSEKNKFIALIESCVLSLDGFIRDIIEYSKNSRVDIEQDEINFASLLNELKKPLIYLIEKEKINFRFDILQDGPFYADRKRIAVVLNNLISNAIKYCDPKKPQLTIHIHIKIDCNEAQIEVSDNGLGIPEGKIDRIFQMFYRANSDKSGSGLGLYIVKEIMDRIGGRISVASELGESTSFYINIPNTRLD